MFNAHPELQNRHTDVTGSLSMLGSRVAPKVLSVTGRAAVSRHGKKVQERRESPRAAQPRRKKILAGVMAQSLVFRREDATSEDASTRRSGKPTELGRIRGCPPRHFGRNMPNFE